jgi:hypothetical protein
MKKTALILALAIVLPAWAQDKAADADKAAEKPAAAQEAEKSEPPKAEVPAKPAAKKHSSRRNEDARHCLEKDSNTEIIKCAEAYL